MWKGSRVGLLLSEQPVQGMEEICAWQKQVMGFLRVWSVDENQVPHILTDYWSSWIEIPVVTRYVEGVEGRFATE